jgi:hypothetical protein
MITGIIIDKDDAGVPAVAHIDLKKYGNELRDFFASKGIIVEEKEPNFPEFEIKKSEEYTDTEILVYNSMLNAAAIIAKDL